MRIDQQGFMNQKKTLFVAATSLMLTLALSTGCFFEPSPEQKPNASSKSSVSGAKETYDIDLANQDALKIEVIGTYRIGDGKYVHDQIKAILPDGLPWSSWGSGGNLTEYEVPSSIDADALAKKISFGKIIQVGPGLIRVQYRYDHEVPARFKQDVSEYHQATDDELGPALKKHDGDWWTALDGLNDLRTRKKNQRGEIFHLGFYSASDETMRHVASLVSLKHLELTMCRHVTDKGALHLRALTNLEELDLFGTSIGNPGQAYLSDLTNLKRLNLSGLGTETGLKYISPLTELEFLSVGYGNGYPVTKDGLMHLKDLRNLKSLRLDGCEISDVGLELIAKFTKLESLKLRGGTMSDAGLAHLSGLKKLRELYRDDTPITDAGMMYLSILAELRILDISKTAVTDQGLDKLRGASNLRDIRAEETDVSRKAIDRFKNRSF